MSQQVIVDGKADDTRSDEISREPSTKMEPSTIEWNHLPKNTDASPSLQSTVNVDDDKHLKQESDFQRLSSSDNLPDIKVILAKKEINGTVKMNNIAEKFDVKFKKIIRGEWNRKAVKMGNKKGHENESKNGCKNTNPYNYKMVGFSIALVIFALYLASVIAPYYMILINFNMNPEFFLDFPLQNASSSPAVITYKLSEGHIFTGNRFSGLIFSHDDLVTVIDHFRESKPLLPLIDTDYDIITQCPFNTTTQDYLTWLLFCGMIFFGIFIIIGFCACSKNSKAVSASKTSFMIETLKFFPALSIVVIFFTLYCGPIFHDYNDSINLLNLPLKNMSFAPTYMTYQFSEAYMLRRENFSGVVLSHDDLVSGFGNCFNGTESLTPLLQLVHPRYEDCYMLVNIAATFPLIMSAGFGVLLYIIYVIIDIGVKLGKRYHRIFSKKGNFKSANLKVEFKGQQINI